MKKIKRINLYLKNKPTDHQSSQNATNREEISLEK